MLALFRQAIPEAVRGLSTGFIVWAGASPCAPTLVCAACPDCTCTFDVVTRRGAPPEGACTGIALSWLVFALLVGVALGAVGARAIGFTPRRIVGKCGRGVVLQLA